MSQNIKTVIEQRVDELSRELSTAANEYDEARRYHISAVARWDDAQFNFTLAKTNLETYLAGLGDLGEES